MGASRAVAAPCDSHMARDSPFCATDWCSDDELWLHPDAPPSRPACTPLVATIELQLPHPIRPRGHETKAKEVRRD